RIEREHAIDRLRRVGRVQRRENEVARVRGLQRRIERFEISNFADEDDVGVLTQHAAKGLTERRRVGADLALVDVRVHVTMEELDRVLDRDDVGAAILIDVLDHRRQRRRLARAGNSRDEDETTRLHRDLLEHRGQAQLDDRLRLIRDGPHRVAEGAALLIQVDAEPSDARYTDREVAFLLFGEHVDLARRHQLLGEGFEILGTERRMIEGLQLAVDADRWRPSDFQVQVGSVPLDHLLEDGFEIDARWPRIGGQGGGLGGRSLRWISHW